MGKKIERVKKRGREKERGKERGRNWESEGKRYRERMKDKKRGRERWESFFYVDIPRNSSYSQFHQCFYVQIFCTNVVLAAFSTYM